MSGICLEILLMSVIKMEKGGKIANCGSRVMNVWQRFSPSVHCYGAF